MYPFERFTARAKKVLTLAQEEAERAHHSYIGTEHLLLGLMREGDGLAAQVLKSLGVEIAPVRQAIESVLARDVKIVVQQIIPTSRVKKVIEIAFETAREMGHGFVGTEHLLLGLLIEGEGIAAHVLNDLGVTLHKVRPEVERLLGEVGEEETSPDPTGATAGARESAPEGGLLSPRLAELIRQAHEEAAARGAPVVDLEHLLRALTDEAGFQALTRLLDRLGVGWKPPEEVERLGAALREVRRQKASAIARRDYPAAASLREQEKLLAAQYQLAEAAWLQSLRPQEPPP
jgi:ATP-dependent Clp protease ATP-binding subunit ClpA